MKHNLFLVLFPLLLHLCSATVYSDLNSCSYCLWKGLSWKWLSWCTKDKGSCRDVDCGQAVTNILDCSKVEQYNQYNLTINDNTTDNIKVFVDTFKPEEYAHYYQISNQLQLQGSIGYFYFNYNNESLQFYYTNNKTEKDFTNLQKMCEGSSCTININ